MGVAPQSRVSVEAVFSVESRAETAKSLEEMIFQASRGALASVNTVARDVDAFVLSGNDEIDGRVISIMAGAGPAGGVAKDTTMIASSADQALLYGYMRIIAGQSDRVLVLGWAKPSESVAPERAELMEAEPYILRDIGMNHTVAAALQASTLVEPGSISAVDSLAWPLSRQDLPAQGDAVYAIVLGREVSASAVAYLTGCGWATDIYDLGSRPEPFTALKAAVRQVETAAPESRPAKWDAVEVSAPSELAVPKILETLGVADVAVNPSGGLVEKGTSPFVSGLARMVAAVKDVSEDGFERVGAIGFNGFAGQGATIAVLEGVER